MQCMPWPGNYTACFAFLAFSRLPPFGLLDAPAGWKSARNALRGMLSTTAAPNPGLHAKVLFEII